MKLDNWDLSETGEMKGRPAIHLYDTVVGRPAIHLYDTVVESAVTEELPMAFENNSNVSNQEVADTVETVEVTEVIDTVENVEATEAVDIVAAAGTTNAADILETPMPSPSVYMQDNRLQMLSFIPPCQLPQAVESAVYEEDESDKVSNFDITPLKKRVYINRDGVEDRQREVIISNITIVGCQPEEFVIRTKDISNLARIVGERFSLAMINYNVKKVEKIVATSFRSKTRDIPVEKYYTEAGWQIINDMHIYVHDDYNLREDIVFQTGKSLPSDRLSGYVMADTILNAMQLYKDSGPMSVMLIYSLMGVLYKSFDEAGHAPHFLLFIHGKTGSMKTTLSKILYMQLTDELYRDAPRRIDADTVTSFERAIVVSGRDTITLIDDYSPAKSARQRIENEAKLESIIRMVGDGSTKSRSNTNLEDIQGEGVKGMVVLTGELMGKGLSSNLRCLYCGIERNKVNEFVVTSFQENPNRFTSFIQEFVIEIGINWDDVVKYIRDNFQKERELAKEYIRERRLVDCAATLCLASEIFKMFVMKCFGASVLYKIEQNYDMRSDIYRMAAISEAISSEDTPTVQIVKIIDRLLQSGQMNLLRKRPDELSIMGIEGFVEGKYAYVLPEVLYIEVKKAFSNAGVYLPMDANELARFLCDEKIAVASSNGKGKKTYYARILIGKNRKQNFIKLDTERLNTYMEELAEK